MIPIDEKSARYLAHKHGARMVVVISIDGEAFDVTSHGRRASESEAAARLGRHIAERMEDGRLAKFPPPEDGTTLQAVTAKADRLSSLLDEVLAGHGGKTCPLGIAGHCFRCRIAREVADAKKGKI